MTDLPVPVEQALDVPAAPAMLDALRAVLADADATRQQLAEAGDFESIARAVPGLKTLARDLAALIRSAEGDVVALMPAKKVEVPGFGVLERKRSTARKAWQSDALVRLLVRRALDPDGTGEFPADPMEAVQQVVDVLLACAPFTGSTGWRVTALRDRGIDPDEWCEQGDSRDALIIHGAGS